MAPERNSSTVRVLIVEDEDDDASIIASALQEFKASLEVVRLSDGLQASAYINGEAPFVGVSIPHIIFLDLNLPRVDGRQILSETKGKAGLRSIPIIILTSSDSEMDLAKAYRFGANCCIIKSPSAEKMRTDVTAAMTFWLRIADVPRHNDGMISRRQLPPTPVGQGQQIGMSATFHVLVIEDEEDDFALLEASLASQTHPSFVLYHCSKMAEGMSYLSARPVDLVLFDLNLPDAHGLSGMQNVLHRYPNIPLVVYSAVDDKQTALEAVHQGAQDYVLKGSLQPERFARLLRYAIERRRAAVEKLELLAQTQAALAVAEQAILTRDEFLSVASHELKTPLTDMKMRAQLTRRRLLKDGQVDSQTIHKALDTFDRQSDRLNHLIENLLSVARINAGHITLEVEGFDFVPMLREVADQMETQVRAAGAHIVLRCPDCLLGCWDRFRLEQVVTNLLSNAIKYGGAKEIVVELTQVDHKVRLTVADQGIGIAQKDHNRVFQRFERAVGKSAFSGLGLGLYIVRQIVKAHGGAIGVDSSLGHGSVFWVSLPVETPREVQQEGLDSPA
jgi:signal transduction histidine kinase